MSKYTSMSFTFVYAIFAHRIGGATVRWLLLSPSPLLYYFALRFLQSLDDQLEDADSPIWNVDFDSKALSSPTEPQPPVKPPEPSASPVAQTVKMDPLTIKTEPETIASTEPDVKPTVEGSYLVLQI